MFLPSMRGKGRPWLALLFALLLPALGKASTSSQADLQLRTDLNTMVVRVDQGAPLPPGGCLGGYSWHTTYGGCRRAESQPETAACPAGYTGIRTRYRTAYILQANAADIAYEGWGAWYDSCQAVTPPQPTQVVFTVLERPGGVHCNRTIKVRTAHTDGSAAGGINLTWTAQGAGRVASASTTTDSRGEAANTVETFVSNSVRVTVAFGASSQEIVGVCIGGT